MELSLEHIYKLNPYKNIGMTAEAWRRGFLNQRPLCHPGAKDYMVAYRKGRKAAKEIK